MVGAVNRRGFLKSILAAGVAPYVVTTAGVLMPVRQRIVYLPELPVMWQSPFSSTYYRARRGGHAVVHEDQGIYTLDLSGVGEPVWQVC
jgi:hypothetical protein